MKRTALLIMIITILSKLIGFGRDIILSYFYGISNVSDAYLISVTIPTVIFGFVSAGIAAGYIPIYSEIKEKNGENEANNFTNNLINILMILCSIIFIVGLIFTQPIVKIFASGFEGETLALAINFTKVSLLAIYFTGLISIFSGYLQIKNNYVIPALVGLPFNFFVVISIVLSYKINVSILSFGFVIATASQIILMLPFIKKNKFEFKLKFDVKSKNMIKFGIIALPVILGISVNQINILVDRTIASQLTIGGISALNYASRLTAFIQGIFVMSITTALYPIISKMVAGNKLQEVKNTVSKSITAINILVLPSTIGSMIFAVPIVSILFGRGAFDSQAVSMTSRALFFYSIGMVGVGLREVLSRVFYSIQDSKTPMINAAIGMGLNIILNVILSKYLGISGLALATSISATFTTYLLFISLRKKIGAFGMKQISISFLKILFASLVMGGLAKLSFNYLTTSLSQNLALLIAIGIGAISYFVIIYFMKIEDVDVIVGAIKKKLGRGAA